jgi:flagellar basal-body rod modification protein FlgD
MLLADVVSTVGAGSTGAGTPRSQELGKDAFLQLLVTQLRYQNPLEPVDNGEFIAQLSQFSSLEQLTEINKTIGSSLSMQQSLNQTMAVGFLGREVEVSGNTVVLRDGQEPVVRYELAGNANVRIEIRDVQGAVVRTLTPGAQPLGGQEVIWNGRDDHGNALPEGNYTYHVLAVGGGDRQVPVRPFFTGIVDGVRLSDGGTVLSVNGSDVLLSQVTMIRRGNE